MVCLFENDVERRHEKQQLKAKIVTRNTLYKSTVYNINFRHLKTALLIEMVDHT